MSKGITSQQKDLLASWSKYGLFILGFVSFFAVPILGAVFAWPVWALGVWLGMPFLGGAIYGICRGVMHIREEWKRAG